MRCGGSNWWRSGKVSSVKSGKIDASRSAMRPKKSGLLRPPSGQGFERPEALHQCILLGRPFISGPCGLEEPEAQEPLAVHSGEGERRSTAARVSDEMETVEAVGVGGSQNPVHLVGEAKTRRWSMPRIYLEILRERIDLPAEHFE
jgi:hypothetical protein